MPEPVQPLPPPKPGDEKGTSPAFDSGSLRAGGAALGEFKLLRRLGKGGMAEVWLAEQTTLKRNVALKLLRSELMEDESYVKRFQTEAKAAAGLNHPNIVQVYTVGCEKGQHYIAQEYVRGKTLKAILKERGPLEMELALKIIHQVAGALLAAGEQGIVHRDIKPENIMLTPKWEVKVADFGLAQLQGGEKLNLTQDGVTMGTPLYMSPEQVSGQKLDQRSDIYSFGVTCYHMLTGSPPFQAENAVSVAVKHLHETPVPLAGVRKDLPAPVCQMVHKMLAKSPENRYQDAQAILNDVRAMRKAIREGESVDDLVTIAAPESTAFPVRYPALVLITLCLMVFLLGAARGWIDRPRAPGENPNAPKTTVPKFPTAREQYIYAMFEVDNEDAFRAVIDNADPRQDSQWVQLAHEQLALMYLRDKRREEDAREELSILRSFDGGSEKAMTAKAIVGEAYLDAVTDNIPKARQLLTVNPDLESLLSGSWQLLYREVRRLAPPDSSFTDDVLSQDDPPA